MSEEIVIRRKNVTTLHKLIVAVEQQVKGNPATEENNKTWWNGAKKWELGKFKELGLSDQYRSVVNEKLRLLEDKLREHANRRATGRVQQPRQPPPQRSNQQQVQQTYQNGYSPRQQPIQPTYTSSRNPSGGGNQKHERVPADPRQQVRAHPSYRNPNDYQRQYQPQNLSTQPLPAQRQPGTNRPVQPQSRVPSVNQMTGRYQQEAPPQQQQQRVNSGAGGYNDRSDLERQFQAKYYQVKDHMRGSTMQRIVSLRRFLRENSSFDDLEPGRKYSAFLVYLDHAERELNDTGPPSRGYEEGLKTLQRIYMKIKDTDRKVNEKMAQRALHQQQQQQYTSQSPRQQHPVQHHPQQVPRHQPSAHQIQPPRPLVPQNYIQSTARASPQHTPLIPTPIQTDPHHSTLIPRSSPTAARIPAQSASPSPVWHPQQQGSITSPSLSVPKSKPGSPKNNSKNNAQRRSSGGGKNTPAHARQRIRDSNAGILRKRSSMEMSGVVTTESSHIKKPKPSVETPSAVAPPPIHSISPQSASPSRAPLQKRFGGKNLSILKAKSGSTPPTSPEPIPQKLTTDNIIQSTKPLAAKSKGSIEQKPSKIEMKKDVQQKPTKAKAENNLETPTTTPRSEPDPEDSLEQDNTVRRSKIVEFFENRRKQAPEKRKKLDWEAASRIAKQVMLEFDSLF